MTPEEAVAEGLRLWRVEVELEMYVVEKSREDAEGTAKYHAREEMDSENAHVAAFLVSAGDTLPDTWEDSLPWTDETGVPEMTAGEWLTLMPPENDGGCGNE